MWRGLTALTALMIAAAHGAAAAPPELSLPVDCVLGQDCYIEDYVDADPGTGHRDYTCGIKSRDDHRGIDFMLLSFDAMLTGVNVLAAADGTVAAIRDGMADASVTDESRDTIKGRECGNALRIDHGDGWQTLYCHMKQDSLTVKQGDRVIAGDRLGQIGLSGLTNAPHLHLTVLQDGKFVDPFNPVDRGTCGKAAPDESLWQPPLPYDPSGLFTAGFSTEVPEFEAVQTGAARVANAKSHQPLVLYGHVFYAQTGDRLTISAQGPEGEIFNRVLTLEAPQVQLFRAFGRKAPDGGWPPGDYRGYVRLTRGDTVLAVRHADITITP